MQRRIRWQIPKHFCTVAALVSGLLWLIPRAPGQDASLASPVTVDRSEPGPFAPTLRYEAGPVIDVVPGSSAVIIIDPAWKLRLSASPSARLDDGRVLTTQYKRILVRPSAITPVWISDPGEWFTVDASMPNQSASERAFVAEALIVDLPLDALGQGIWVDGSRIGLNWLKTSVMLANLSQSEGLEWSATLTADQRRDQSLMAMLAPLSRSPLTRWRYRLLTDGLAPAQDAGLENVQFADPVLEALAQQQEACWRHGLAKIKQAELIAQGTDASHLVTHSLSRLIAVPTGDSTIWLPCWVEDTATLAQLLNDLVSPHLPPSGAAERARTYAELVPNLIAVGVDDAAALHPATGAPMPLVLALHLGARPVTLAARMIDREGRANSPGSDLVLVMPDHAAWISHVSLSTQADRNSVTSLRIESGLRRVNIPIQTNAQAVIPPGLTLTPFFADWRQDDVLREVPRPRVQPDLTATLSYRSSARADDAPDSPSGWVLLFERRAMPQLRDLGADESITLVWGPRQTESRLMLPRKGPMHEASAVSTPQSRSVVDAGGNWYVEVLLPNSVIERDGVARLGMLWTDGQGTRASWPRPTLPMERSPGRALLNLSAW